MSNTKRPLKQIAKDGTGGGYRARVNWQITPKGYAALKAMAAEEAGK